MKRIAVFTKYSRKGASSRLRTFQYIPKLENEDLKFNVFPLFGDEYLEALYGNGRVSPLYIIKRYAKRFMTLFFLWKYDVVWIEKELFPYLPAFFERLMYILGIKYIVDYDDAIFHNYDLSNNVIIRQLLSKKIDRVMKYSNQVIAGNSYLANRSMSAGSKSVTIIPTVVDTERYLNSAIEHKNSTIRIGWIGTPFTQRYLIQLSDVFIEIGKKHTVELVLIGASDNIKSKLKMTNVVVIKWDESTEAKNISEIDIGIMPLFDEPWEKGKCGYKLIQYMASGKPVVASNVGVNREIIDKCSSGVCVNNIGEWKIALEKLISNKDFYNTCSLNAKKGVEEHYSLNSQLPVLKKVLSLCK
jgi:glycosyltransferase involved in cell wall biosynthesis